MKSQDTNNVNLDFDNLLKTLKDIINEKPSFKKDLQSELVFFNMIQPYMKMTEDEMHKSIPDGAYNISAGEINVITGKGGLIRVILEYQKNNQQA